MLIWLPILDTILFRLIAINMYGCIAFLSIKGIRNEKSDAIHCKSLSDCREDLEAYNESAGTVIVFLVAILI